MKTSARTSRSGAGPAKVRITLTKRELEMVIQGLGAYRDHHELPTDTKSKREYWAKCAGLEARLYAVLDAKQGF